ncbi:MAG: hypothetical protein LBD28_01135 [Tannerellaceae bacterium]|jgi:hypothetical protein|nr:hypothetical protein [Tannerellaceae bacterium]
MRKPSSRYEKTTTISGPFNIGLLLIVSASFWIAGYTQSIGYPVYSEAAATPLWEMVCIAFTSKTGAYLVGLMLLIGGAIIIHRANYVQIIIREKTYLPFLLYLILISCNTAFLPLNAASLAMFCLILAFYQILKTYRDPDCIANIYNASLLLGVGSLLWIHLLWFVPVFWWGMYSLKSMSIRGILASLTGLATVYWFLAGWCVWTRSFDALHGPFLSLTMISRPELNGIRTADWIFMIAMIILAGASILNIFIHEYDESVRTRQFLFFTIIIALISFSLALVYEQQRIEFLGLSCMPLAILASHLFATSKFRKKGWIYCACIALYVLLSVIRSPWNFLPPDVL